MAMANKITDENVETIPVAKPAIIFVAAPVDEFLTMSRTGFLPNAV